jgi:hypothetical protein
VMAERLVEAVGPRAARKRPGVRSGG